MQKGAEMAMDKQPVTTNENFKWYAGNNIIAKCTWLCNNNSVYKHTEFTELPEYGMFSSGQDKS